MRIEGWEAALNEIIQSRTVTPFKWGEHDCCLFAADCVEAMTGRDYADKLRGSYKNAAEAKKVINAYGDMETMISSLLGAPCETAFAHRGDVMMLDTSSGPALGICCGKLSVFAGHTGLVYHKTMKCCMAWRIE